MTYVTASDATSVNISRYATWYSPIAAGSGCSVCTGARMLSKETIYKERKEKYIRQHAIE